MIHTLLNLTRTLVIFDTETTGLDTQNDRVIELAFELWTPSGLEKDYRTLVNPGRPIPSKVSKVHGYTDVDFINCRTCGQPLPSCCELPRGWPTFKQLAPSLASGFSNCDYGGKNIRFDLQMLASEFERVGVRWSVDNAKIVDADRLEALLNPRALKHLYKKYTGKDLGDAHSALADVRGTTTVLEHQLQAGDLPRDVEKLHELSFPGMIDVGGKFLFVDGVPCFSRWGKYAGQPMTRADAGYWDFILKNDFPSDVKRLAAEAKLGKFPQSS